MNTDMDPVFTTTLRRSLVEQATTDTWRSRQAGRRAWWIGGVSLMMLGATGVAMALVGFPGAEVETRLSEAQSVTTEGVGALPLGPLPDSATAVHFEFDCLAVGHFLIGTAGVAVTCTSDDVGETQAWGLMPLDSLESGAVRVEAAAQSSWRLEAWYVDTDRTPLARNENGETYGVDSDETPPDLIQVQATNGQLGYVRRSELQRMADLLPTSPARAAVHEQKEYSINVYGHDGVTVLGEVVVG